MAVLPSEQGEQSTPETLDEHLVVKAVSSLLSESLQGRSARHWRSAPDDFASATYGTIISQVLEPGPESQEQRVALEECLEEEGDGLAKPLQPRIKDVWEALLACSEHQAAESRRLGLEDMEELVLAHLHSFPAHLGRSLIGRLVQQLVLGQSLADGDGKLRAAELLQALSPHLPQLLPIAREVASATCDHLTAKSDVLAAKLMQKLDPDKDGLVQEKDFLERALDVLNLEVENVAVGVALPALLKNADFADIFHPAMAACLGISVDATP